jgi:23S rRNA (cytosine1962-C5)-methyltransferase
MREVIVAALQTLPGIKAVYNKSAESLKNKAIINGYLWGAQESPVVKEHNLLFQVDWVAGQKTGFFLDQRENRLRLQQMASGAKVLNLFCYTGGFSVYALAGGAREVVSVDISAPAVAQAAANASLNGFEAHHTAIVADCFEYLKQMPDDFDIVILDPPAFAKNLRATHNALVAYKRLNAMALKKMKSGSKLLTFSCSQHITAPLFADAVRAAAIEVGKSVQIIGHFTQPEDHPNNIFHPEGQYLKGLLLQLT